MGLCNIVKCKVLANLPEKDYAKQLDEIKWICDEKKEEQNIINHWDEMLMFIKKAVNKLK